MATNGVPTGYHSVTPALIVRDAPAAIEFYKKAFGAEEFERMLGPDGKVAHAEIQIGDSRVMLGEESAAWGTLSPLTTKSITSSLHVYVPDADAAFARALSAGATVRTPLSDAFWGDRYGKLVDPFGHEWGIASRIKDMTVAEMEEAGRIWMAEQSALNPQT